MIILKINKIIIVFIAVILVLMVGCSNTIKNEGNKIVVQKRVDESNSYEYLKEINDSNEVQNIKNILDNIDWENVIVDMAYPPHYKFKFEDTNKGDDIKMYNYSLWISPNNDKVELVIEGEEKYIQLNEEKSAELFEIITDKKLIDTK